MPKTNAVRLLDREGIHYELREYQVDDSDLSAERVANAIGMPPEQVFKTLVARGDRTGVLLACIPGSTELDFKALADASGNKRVEMVAVKELPFLTGYVRGGVSPLGLKKMYPLYLDETADLWDVISVSAGVRGLQMLVEAHRYRSLSAARPGEPLLDLPGLDVWLRPPALVLGTSFR